MGLILGYLENSPTEWIIIGALVALMVVGGALAKVKEMWRDRARKNP